MSKKYQIYLGILLFLTVAGFFVNMIIDSQHLWIRGYNLLVVILWGIFIFSGRKNNDYKNF
ncbi:hypothetical protein B5V89_14575 [Heyndrickxia sporothermodurans]|nr:hypothetical protein B5V89_14575 [Heyndrickxia sporothermodurans]